MRVHIYSSDTPSSLWSLLSKKGLSDMAITDALEAANPLFSGIKVALASGSHFNGEQEVVAEDNVIHIVASSTNRPWWSTLKNKLTS